MLVDTHCHIHEASYPLDASEVLRRARAAGVEQLICVGTDIPSSKAAALFATKHPAVYSAVGVHPHEARGGWTQIERLLKQVSASQKVVAVGEVGLDYFYTHSSQAMQQAALEAQIQWALNADVPLIFHVRDAFTDFWPIFDNFHGIRGVVHSFTDTTQQLDEALRRGLYIGVNGISTFTKDEAQRNMFDRIPLDRMVLETDAPFLTPVPLRGRVNEPAFVRHIAEHVAANRRITIEEVAVHTTTNAHALFVL